MLFAIQDREIFMRPVVFCVRNILERNAGNIPAIQTSCPEALGPKCVGTDLRSD